MLKCSFKISSETQSKQLWAPIKTFLFQKGENGRRARNDQTKARLKPSRKTLPGTLCLASYMSYKRCEAVHTASLLGWCHLLPEALIRRSMFQHLKYLENSTAVSTLSTTSPPALSGLPAGFQLSYTLPGLPSLPLKFEEASWNSCNLHWAQSQNHVVDNDEVYCQSVQ